MDTNSANSELLTPMAASHAAGTRHGLHRTVLALATLAMAAGFAGSAQAANSFTDGGFAGFTGSSGLCSSGSSHHQMTSADEGNWTANSDYTFVLNANNYGSFANTYGGNNCIGLKPTVTASPEGGNFLGIDPSFENNNDGHGWSIAQALTGLVVGATYNITFNMGAGQQTGFAGATNDTWLVGLGAGTNISTVAGTGNSASSQTISPGANGAFGGWVSAQVSLLATSINEVLWFFAESQQLQQQPPFLLLDGITMSQQTTVPEPSTYGVLLVGLLALLGVRRVYRNKRA
jgi:PEP-CTERM motif